MTTPSENPPPVAPDPEAIEDTTPLPIIGPQYMTILGTLSLVAALVVGFLPHGGYGSVLGGRDPQGEISSSASEYQLVMSAATTWTWLFLGAGVLMLVGAMHATAVRRPYRGTRTRSAWF
jgi:hypothetical protein